MNRVNRDCARPAPIFPQAPPPACPVGSKVWLASDARPSHQTCAPMGQAHGGRGEYRSVRLSTSTKLRHAELVGGFDMPMALALGKT